MRVNLATAAGLVLIVVCGGAVTALYLKDHRPSDDLIATTVRTKDAGDILAGNIAPNPIISGSLIRRNQISDPMAIYAIVQKALAGAPPAGGVSRFKRAEQTLTGGDAKALAFKQFADKIAGAIPLSQDPLHDEFVDKQLSSFLPLHGEHLIELQCGTSGPFGQSFLTYRPLTHRLDVVLPQLPPSEIQSIQEIDKALTSAVMEYYKRKIELNRLAPDTTGNTYEEDAILYKKEKLKDLEDKLALEGASFSISDTKHIIAENTPFDGLSAETDINLTKAQTAFLELEHGQRQGDSDAVLKASNDLASSIGDEDIAWTSFPSHLDKIQSWYDDVALAQRPESICLLARFRDLYPFIFRPNKLVTPLMVAKPNEDDLRGSLIAWYLIDRHSGAILTSKKID